MKYTLMFLMLLSLGTGSALGQQRRSREIELGPGMSRISSGLMQVAGQSNFFLDIATKIGLTDLQIKSLEEIVSGYQEQGAQRTADLDVSEAELQRLLTRSTIDLDVVRAKLKEVAAIETDLKMMKVEALLRAIKALTHQQHVKIMALVRQPTPEEARPNSFKAQ